MNTLILLVDIEALLTIYLTSDSDNLEGSYAVEVAHDQFQDPVELIQALHGRHHPLGLGVAPDGRQPLLGFQDRGPNGHGVQVAVHGVEHHRLRPVAVLHQEVFEFLDFLV